MKRAMKSTTYHMRERHIHLRKPPATLHVAPFPNFYKAIRILFFCRSAKQMAYDGEETTLSESLKYIGGFAGFMLGSGMGAEDPEIGFWTGAFVGMLMGAAGGWSVGRSLEVMFQIAFMVAGLALSAARIFGFINFAVG